MSEGPDNGPTGAKMKVNPLDIDLIRVLVLDRLEPRYVLACREVNHSWHRPATQRLTDAGWKVHLSGSRIEEYVQLRQAVGVSSDDGSALSPMKLSLHVNANASRSAAARNAEVTNAIRLVKTEGFDCIISSLECTLGRPADAGPLEALDRSLNLLIVLSSASLEKISFKISALTVEEEGESGSDVMELWNSRFISTDLRLPSLQSLSVEYIMNPEQDFRTSTNLQIMQLVDAAPNLRCVRDQRSGKDPFELYESFLPHLFQDIAISRPEGLVKNLTEVDIYQSQVILLNVLSNETVFEALRILRVSTTDNICVSGGGPNAANLLQFIRTRCPTLESLQLELIDVLQDPSHPNPPMQIQADRLGPPISTVTHLGFHLCPPPVLQSPPMSWEPSERAVQHAERVLLILARLPNLTSVSLNLEALISIEKLYERLDLPDVFNEARAPFVTTMTLDVNHGVMPESSSTPLSLRSTATVHELFPSLERLVINLGGDRVSWKLGTSICPLLDFSLLMPGLIHIEINNYYNAWTLDEGQAMSPPHVNRKLETLTLRGASRSFCSQHIDTRTHSAPRVDLCKLLALIPEQLKPRLTLRIDADLLLCGRSTQSFTQLLEKALSMNNPRLELI